MCFGHFLTKLEICKDLTAFFCTIVVLWKFLTIMYWVEFVYRLVEFVCLLENLETFVLGCPEALDLDFSRLRDHMSLKDIYVKAKCCNEIAFPSLFSLPQIATLEVAECDASIVSFYTFFPLKKGKKTCYRTRNARGWLTNTLGSKIL